MSIFLSLFVLISLNMSYVGAKFCKEGSEDDWGCPSSYWIRTTRDLVKRRRNGEDLPSRRTLDLGCGSYVRNPFLAEERYGLDFVTNASRNISSWDGALDPIPFPDQYFDYVTAYDFLEHVPRLVYVPERRNSLVELMNEIYRVLKPCGVFFSVTPIYPHLGAFADPTHVNYMTQETFVNYFDHVLRWAGRYGYTGDFFVDRSAVKVAGAHAHVSMQAIGGACEAPPLSPSEQSVKKVNDELIAIAKEAERHDAYELYVAELDATDTVGESEILETGVA